MAVLEQFVAELPPLHMDEGGTVRVGHTRITLDTVAYEYTNGSTPEQIVQNYDTLMLADVYAVFAYILNHRAQVDAYLKRREQEAAAVRQENEQRFPPDALRVRMEAKRASHEPPA